MIVKLEINNSSIDNALRELERYEKKIDRAGAEIVRKLSIIGYDVAYSVMHDHIWTGETIDSLTVIERSPTKYILMAQSEALMFFEFGAGVKGYGHPRAGEFGAGPGTYPGQTHALDPGGWWYETDDDLLIEHIGKDGRGYAHTYGNEPRMPFQQAVDKMKDDLLKVAKEVLSE